MRCFNQGAYVRVTVSEAEVYDFMRHWPCSGLSGRALSFTFESRNGDLVDHTARDDEDGAALVALSQDASNYAAKRLRRPELARA